MVSDVIDFEFKTLNPTEFEFYLKMNSSSRMMNMLFNKAKNKLRDKKNIIFSGSPDDVKEIDVPKNYFNYLNTILHKQRSFIVDEVAKDGIVVLNYRIESAVFFRVVNGWDIKIVFGGDYVDKR